MSKEQQDRSLTVAYRLLFKGLVTKYGGNLEEAKRALYKETEGRRLSFSIEKGELTKAINIDAWCE